MRLLILRNQPIQLGLCVLMGVRIYFLYIFHTAMSG